MPLGLAVNGWASVATGRQVIGIDRCLPMLTPCCTSSATISSLAEPFLRPFSSAPPANSSDPRPPNLISYPILGSLRALFFVPFSSVGSSHSGDSVPKRPPNPSNNAVSPSGLGTRLELPLPPSGLGLHSTICTSNIMAKQTCSRPPVTPLFPSSNPGKGKKKNTMSPQNNMNPLNPACAS